LFDLAKSSLDKAGYAMMCLFGADRTQKMAITIVRHRGYKVIVARAFLKGVKGSE